MTTPAIRQVGQAIRSCRGRRSEPDPSKYLAGVPPIFPASPHRLVYATNASLDGYVEDAAGAFDWSRPDEEVHAFWDEHQRGIGTALYGRRMFETMRVWEEDDWLADEPAVVREFAEVWRAIEKVVYSSTLAEVTTSHTRLERTFDPAEVRALKARSEADLSISGATLAAEALRHGLVDECLLLLSPVAVGGGKPVLPHDVRLDLELLEQRRFTGGVVLLRYSVLGR